MFYLWLALFGCMSGISAVLFGFGGGFVVVPLLYRMLLGSHGADDAVAQSAMHIAVATSTCVMIVNALMATGKHRRAGNLIRHYLWPLGGYIGLGAIAGAGLAMVVSGEVMRYAFIAYLALTIADCLMRRGFLEPVDTRTPRRLGRLETTGGLGIGVIATFLGVGGSVMTVPLLRRCGLSMTQATSMANPLSVPVALAGTLTYMALAGFSRFDLGPWFIGYVDLLAFVVLTLGSLLGIRLASPWIGRIPDRLHARVYIGLLVLVMLGMLVR
ncbi:sulfite exporter TauE/SafE family protein [Pseudomonas chlororaphis]|uniref:sulfite exporter TauE/SafE family protein n=1 Tax=Pseudomonas chlororaphis TaxID=587753 RepID=UPI0006A5C1DB|nr:sulfite exporter TauE/SafE family protein [Pseudomonas chlororaphis]AZC32836.1 Integral membrane protein [Pseudomonas chlororaphis subsp. piscium]MBP5075356.1 sulfite exporter TauE/SafE family protein [Pseudomonas chlororaphis]WDG76558.1 sulfite exporter TauE/SafE family protein [Pseudomonas chlororaphis]WDG84203.1 sulfite exporter TauE/SafE family protein [Pseudomonas chlororaphis]WDG90529.1 sulfite exporter TauE/SafE family protein [Pseudomonas chlororaphis]